MSLRQAAGVTVSGLLRHWIHYTKAAARQVDMTQVFRVELFIAADKIYAPPPHALLAYVKLLCKPAR